MSGYTSITRDVWRENNQASGSGRENSERILTWQRCVTGLGEGVSEAVTNDRRTGNESSALTEPHNADQDWSELVSTVGAELQTQRLSSAFTRIM